MPNNLSSRFSLKPNIEEENKEKEVSPENIIQVKQKTGDIATSDDNFKTCCKELEDKIQNTPVWFEYSKEQQTELIRTFILNQNKQDNNAISNDDINKLTEKYSSSDFVFGAVQHLLDNEKVDSVTVNGTNSVYISIENKILNTETKLTENQLQYLINSIKNLTKTQKFSGVDKFTTDNFNITVISEKFSKCGINIKIEKRNEFNKEFLIQNNIMTDKIFDFILSAVNQKKNIIVSGDIDTFKTKFLEILLQNLTSKRVCLLEKTSQITADFNTLSKFNIKPDEECFSDLISEILKQKFEYLVSDFNKININLIQNQGTILTLRTKSAENALKDIIGSYMSDDLPEKFARTRALENIDYIIHFEKTDSGRIILSTVLELKPAKTIQASIKTIVKFADNKYITNFTSRS